MGIFPQFFECCKSFYHKEIGFPIPPRIAPFCRKRKIVLFPPKANLEQFCPIPRKRDFSPLSCLCSSIASPAIFLIYFRRRWYFKTLGCKTSIWV